jgi:hypothetical protein
MAKKSSVNQGEATKPVTSAGFVEPDLIPSGWKQVKGLPDYFLYRGDKYKLSEITKKQLERILSYRKNPWFVRQAN